jgi:ABC-2 type transport system permease protein
MSTIRSIPIYDSKRRGSPALEEFKELIKYRNLVAQTVRRNILVRYKRSILGIAWTMLNPLGTTIILALVFSKVFGSTASYAAYVLSGLICWTFFAQTTSDSMAQLIWGGGLIKRIYVPRTVFAVSSIGTGLVNLCLALVPLILVLLVTGVPIRPSILLLPIPILFLSMFSLGLGLLLSSIAVQFVDVTEMYQIALTAWMYLSPVIYTIDMLPEEFLWLVKLNPMFHIINLFRDPIYYGRVPELSDILLTGGIALVTLVIGWFLFAQKADEFAYRV